MIDFVKISSLRKRFDVRYHFSDDADIEKSWTLESLKETIVRDPNCYGFNYSTCGVPLVRISDMKQPFIDFSRIARVSGEIHSKFKKTHLKPYDILISVRGMSTGKVSIFLGEVPEANISPNIIIVRLKDVSLAPYVVMVLISKIGQSQIKRFFSGGGKPSLTAPMINQIEIPCISQNRLSQINALFSAAKKERLQAATLLAKIDTTFDQAFVGAGVMKSVVGARKLSQLNERWDSHYHNPGYDGLRNFVKGYKGKSKGLADFSTVKNVSQGNLDPRSKIEYIEIGSINNLIGIIDAPIVDYPGNLPAGQKCSVVDGDILISKVRPYLNANVAFHTSDKSIPAVASKSAFVILDTAQLHLKHYLVAFLRSPIGLNQIVMHQSGTSYPTVSEDDVLKVVVLFLPDAETEVVNSDYKKYVEVKLLEEVTTKAISALIHEDEQFVEDLEHEVEAWS